MTATEDFPQPTGKRGGYSFEDDFGPMFKGEMVPPNLEEIDLDAGMSSTLGFTIEAVRPVCYFLPPAGGGATSRRYQARYYLSCEQSGRYNGYGYVVWDIEGSFSKRPDIRMATFAFCVHEKRVASTADRQRGWRPGYCFKCGLDMTVDSGD